MNIVIVTPDGDKSEYFFEASSISIGRGQSCDIVINDDHISRNHLEIKKIEDLFFLKDLTLSNWVSYNEEKLEKGVDVQYYDFAPLILPGLYKVEISDEGPIEEEEFEIESSKTRTKTTTTTKTKTDVDLYRDKITAVSSLDLDEKRNSKRPRKGKKWDKNKKKKSKNELGMMAIILAAAVAYIVYQFFFINNTQSNQTTRNVKKPSRIENKIVRKRIIRKKQSNKIVTDTNLNKKESQTNEKDPFLDILKINVKCQSLNVKQLCKSIFPVLTKYEGLHIVDRTAYVVKNYKIRGAYLLRSSEKFKQTNLPTNKLEKIIAGEGVLLPNFLKNLEMKNINKIIILLFRADSRELQIIKKFKVDVSDYRKYEKDKYIKSYSKIVGQQKIDLFEQYLERFLNEL